MSLKMLVKIFLNISLHSSPCDHDMKLRVSKYRILDKCLKICVFYLNDLSHCEATRVQTAVVIFLHDTDGS